MLKLIFKQVTLYIVQYNMFEKQKYVTTILYYTGYMF